MVHQSRGSQLRPAGSTRARSGNGRGQPDLIVLCDDAASEALKHWWTDRPDILTAYRRGSFRRALDSDGQPETIPAGKMLDNLWPAELLSERA